MYNIEIDGVCTLSDSRKTAPAYAVRIGDMNYAKEHSVLGDTYGITLRNVISHMHCAVNVTKGLKDSLIENIIVTEGEKFGFAANESGAVFDNCTVRNIVTAGTGAKAVKPGGYTGNLIIG